MITMKIHKCFCAEIFIFRHIYFNVIINGRSEEKPYTSGIYANAFQTCIRTTHPDHPFHSHVRNLPGLFQTYLF
jgi:hypothetical protein